MKVMIARQSGLPIDESKLADFQAEWHKGFDELKRKHGSDMVALEKELNELEDGLSDKYERVSLIELPISAKAWKKLIDEYSGVLVSTHKDTGKILLIIMDQGL